MQDHAIRTLGTICGVAVLLGAFVAACAGTDTPARTDELEQLIADTYTNRGQVGAGAGAGAGGGGGSATGGSSSGGSSSMGTGGSGSGCDGFAVLEANCSGSTCHGAGTGFTPFAASLEDASDFVDTGSAICGSQDNAPIFNPDNPAASLVVRKAAGTSACGGRMPPGNGPYLSQADLECLQTWIGSL